jgi:Fe-S cluster assembly ATP-binding protein
MADLQQHKAKKSLTIKDLRVRVDGNLILKGIDLEIKPGEIHALMGPNGSGKTSLALSLLGHPAYKILSDKDYPSRVTLDGKDILSISPDKRAKEGLFLAFQQPAEVPGVRVNGFLRQTHGSIFGLESKKEYPSAYKFYRYLDQLAEKIGVDSSLLNRNLNEGFSGGEKKQLEMLQLVVLSPKYAILDETDSGLDVDALKIVAKAVEEVRLKHKTGVLIITHYLRILEHVKPEFVHVMKSGRIVQSGGYDLAQKLEKSGYK